MIALGVCYEGKIKLKIVTGKAKINQKYDEQNILEHIRIFQLYM